MKRVAGHLYTDEQWQEVKNNGCNTKYREARDELISQNIISSNGPKRPLKLTLN